MKKKAFTLIELLVVIGVIALLCSILIPSLQKMGGSNGSNRYPETKIGSNRYPETKIGSNVYQIEVNSVSYWSDAVKQFTQEHPDLKIISITKPSENDWHKYVVITTGNPE